MFVDVHCHLEMFRDLRKIVSESVSQGTKTIVSASVDMNSMKSNLKISGKFSEVECCLGVHPVNLLSMKEKELSESISFLKKNISSCKAVGEIGVDFKYADSAEKKEKQFKVYREQLLIAEENSMPVVVHSRFAEKKSLEILSDFNGKVLLHWFDGSTESFKEGLKRNYFFSVGPAIIFNPDYLKKVLVIPLENLLLETDSPVEFEGKKAMPFWVKKVAEKLAEEKSISLKGIEEQTTKNAIKFFSL
ncbi:MAG: TatD family hydrolase [archaeon]